MPPNAFALFVKRYAKQNPGLSGPDLMRAASKAYKAQGGGTRRTAAPRKKSRGRRPDIAAPQAASGAFLPRAPELSAAKLNFGPSIRGMRSGITHGVRRL